MLESIPLERIKDRFTPVFFTLFVNSVTKQQSGKPSELDHYIVKAAALPKHLKNHRRSREKPSLDLCLTTVTPTYINPIEAL
jgi:hypothetical protein